MLINLTPHPIVLRAADGAETTIQPSGGVARVSTLPSGSVETIPGIPVPVAPATRFGEIEGLPAPQAGTFLIVSGMVGAQCAGRPDVLVPGTGPSDGAVRNEKGHIVAVTRLNRV